MVFKLALLEHGVAKDDNSSCFKGSIHAHKKLRDILQVQGHAVTFRHTSVFERGGQRATLAIQVAIADSLVEVIDRCLLRSSFHRLKKHLQRVCEARCNIRRYIAGIVLEPGTGLVELPGFRRRQGRLV